MSTTGCEVKVSDNCDSDRLLQAVVVPRPDDLPGEVKEHPQPASSAQPDLIVRWLRAVGNML
ncbi:hypothetical protein J6590_045635 [Homalodisca vitripennis]|nr:hypothetical protein J6590_045635 [Homalodisca vitripennis]